MKGLLSQVSPSRRLAARGFVPVVVAIMLLPSLPQMSPPVLAAPPCTPSPFHLHFTKFVNPRYQGVARWRWVTPPSQRGANRTNLAQSMSFTTSVTETVNVTTGVEFEVDVNAIVTAAKASTSLSVAHSIERGTQWTLNNNIAPHTEGWVQMKAPIYQFQGVLQVWDAVCNKMTSQRTTIVTIPGKPEAVWSARRI
jgi:hypothetical protein